MDRLTINTRKSVSAYWSGYLAEFVGCVGTPESGYVGKGRTEDAAVEDLLKQAGWKAARRSGREYTWVARRS